VKKKIQAGSEVKKKPNRISNAISVMKRKYEYKLSQRDAHTYIVIQEFPGILYCFTSRSRIVHSDGDITIAGEGLQILGLSSALRAFDQGGIFIVPHVL
jgi:hypothetical protein